MGAGAGAAGGAPCSSRSSRKAIDSRDRSLAGRVIPPGPSDPIKARWMGFWDGAGIHGTEETWSIGHAASHGCIRMTIADVEQLYPLVPLGTPIYVD